MSEFPRRFRTALAISSCLITSQPSYHLCPKSCSISPLGITSSKRFGSSSVLLYLAAAVPVRGLLGFKGCSLESSWSTNKVCSPQTLPASVPQVVAETLPGFQISRREASFAGLAAGCPLLGGALCEQGCRR